MYLVLKLGCQCIPLTLTAQKNQCELSRRITDSPSKQVKRTTPLKSVKQSFIMYKIK